MIHFLLGAVTLGYAIAGTCFLRFWRKTHDRFFIHFAFAFWLFACNQVLILVLGADDERVGYAYLLRVVGYLLILIAILSKNVSPLRRP